MRFDKDKFVSISLMILQELSKFADEVIEPMTLSGMRKRINYSGHNPRSISNNISSLERRGYIEIDRTSDSIKLTNKGRIKLIEKSNDNEINGKWRMLSYDIPEKLRNKRAQFRRSIKRVGFKQAQKSLWACPFSKADKIELVIKDLDLEKYVAYLLVEKTDIDNYLKTLFKLELSIMN